MCISDWGCRFHQPYSLLQKLEILTVIEQPSVGVQDSSFLHTLSSHYKQLQVCRSCSYFPRLGTYPFLVEVVNFANPTMFYKSWHFSQYLVTLLLMQQSHPSSRHSHHITSVYASARMYLNWEYWPQYPFLNILAKIANPTLIYKDWHYSHSLATLLLMQQDWLSSTILEVGMYLLASAHIYLNWEYWPHIHFCMCLQKLPALPSFK
jgi:hypothetical protein